VAVVAVEAESRPTPVYNLEVAGDHTYFAAGVWVHNNSCSRLHHIATNKNWVRHPQWSAKFDAIFKKGGMTLEDAANRLELPVHNGPHSQNYHQWVYDELNKAVRGLKREEQIGAAIKGTLAKLAVIIENDAAIINR
jgi:hypothetical protein